MNFGRPTSLRWSKLKSRVDLFSDSFNHHCFCRDFLMIAWMSVFWIILTLIYHGIFQIANFRIPVNSTMVNSSTFQHFVFVTSWLSMLFELGSLTFICHTLYQVKGEMYCDSQQKSLYFRYILYNLQCQPIWSQYWSHSTLPKYSNFQFTHLTNCAPLFLIHSTSS